MTWPRRGAQAMISVKALTLAETLRERVRAEFCCPTCGAPQDYRATAAKIGVNHTTLWRFVKGGKPGADLLDKLYARYLEPKP